MMLKAWIEIIPSECGKHWKVPETFTVTSRCGEQLTVEKDFVFDRYTFVPDFKDWKPAAAHDKAYKCKRWDDGAPISFMQANYLLLDLMLASKEANCRDWARIYFAGVVTFGWIDWWL